MLLPAPLPAGRPRPRFSPSAGLSPSVPTEWPVLGSTLRVTLRPPGISSTSCLEPCVIEPILGAPARRSTSLIMSSQPSSATSFLPPLRNIAKSLASSLPFWFLSSFFWPPLSADFIASAATSPSISSTSFLAPAILSAKVILSLGGAKAAKLCDLAGDIFSLTCSGFLPVCGMPILRCKSLRMSSSEPWPSRFNTAPPTFLAMPPTRLTTSPRPSSMSFCFLRKALLNLSSCALCFTDAFLSLRSSAADHFSPARSLAFFSSSGLSSLSWPSSYLSYRLRTGSNDLPSRPALAKACMPSLPYFS